MFFRFNFFTIVWAIVILFLVLMPGQQMPKISGDYLLSIDKLAHAFVFCILVLLMIVGFIKQHRFPRLRTKAVTYSLLISIAYGLILEIMQLLSSARMVELLDAGANIAGCLSGWLLFLLIYRL